MTYAGINHGSDPALAYVLAPMPLGELQIGVISRLAEWDLKVCFPGRGGGWAWWSVPWFEVLDDTHQWANHYKPEGVP